jgi:hypothetical protein
MPCPSNTLLPRDNLFPSEVCEDEEEVSVGGQRFNHVAAIHRDDDDMLMIIANFARML